LEELFKALEMSRDCNFQEEEALSLYHLSITYKYLGDLDHALEYALKGLSIAREIGEKMPESYNLNCIGGIYYEMRRYEEAHNYYQQSLELRQKIGDQWGVAGCYDNLGNLYLQQGKYREALNFCLQSLDITQHTGDLKGSGNTLFNVGKIYAELQEYDLALDYLRQSLQARESISDKKGLAEIYCFLGSLYQDNAFPYTNTHEALDYLSKALSLAENLNARDIEWKIHFQLSKSYKNEGAFEQALQHYETSAMIEKEVNNETVQQKILNLQITHRVAQTQKEAEIFRLKNVALANLIEEINLQKDQLQSTLENLKSTQAQLIQSEKMASLGELTVGIAHEIQNPLNFVNNFSEVNRELVDELQQELKEGRIKDAIEISNEIKSNEEKINHHGKRADAIVKGMLQHSRTSRGQKEQTDINALCDEYLRLAYHGLKAKDQSSFNASSHFEPDNTLPKLNVVPQDIGRVLLNLINNAFYAVRERVKSETGNVKGDSSYVSAYTFHYEPRVTVSTKKLGDRIEISVKDNGSGIPDAIKEKIFQPFFTTKPTGQGTGLGLSLSYDIVKAHGGALRVETKEGAGSEFSIILPL
jgi:two-component system, NtrC family, sensor kinase